MSVSNLKLSPLQQAGAAFFVGDAMMAAVGASPLDPSNSNMFLAVAGISGVVASGLYLVAGHEFKNPNLLKKAFNSAGQLGANLSVFALSAGWFAAGLFPKGWQQFVDVKDNIHEKMVPTFQHMDWTTSIVGLAGLCACVFPLVFKDPTPDKERFYRELPDALRNGDIREIASILKNTTQYKKLGTTFFAANAIFAAGQFGELVQGIMDKLPAESLSMPATALLAVLIYEYGCVRQSQASLSSVKETVEEIRHGKPVHKTGRKHQPK